VGSELGRLGEVPVTKDLSKRKAYQRAYYAKNREKICARVRAYVAENREKVRTAAKVYRKNNPEKIRITKARIKYGLPENDYQKLVNSRSTCALCGAKPSGKGPSNSRLHIDHCHKTGKVRALLCGNCNTALGLMKDNPKLLRKAANYLEAHR
jgi:hypothetical protein